MKSTIEIKSCLAACILPLFLFVSVVFAGNIDPAGDGHKYTYGENVGWSNWSAGSGPGVTVEDDNLVGFIWSENIGWITLNPQFGGVIHDGRGKLSGYAWSENCGWINFSCTTNNTCSSVEYGVTIDTATGVFSGYAWGENIGWIHFNYSGFPNPADSHVLSSWRMDGDISSDGVVALEDAIMALQVCSGVIPGSTVHAGADINDDYLIGLAEVVFVLQQVSEQ